MTVNHRSMAEKLQKWLFYGDSLLKFAGKACTRKDYDVRCYPGIRLEELRHQVEEIY